MMAQAPRLTVRVAATPSGVQLAAGEFERFWTGLGRPLEAAWPLQLALDEILSNIVRQASAAPEGSSIDVAVDLREDAVEMTVSDDGPAFDPLQVPEPDLSSPLEERQPGGLGVHFVRRLMDRVEYSRARGRNCLVMTWRPAGQAVRTL